MEPTDTQLDNALEYSRVLAEVEAETIAAFTAHFAGKPGQYVPGIRIKHYEPHFSDMQEFGEPCERAIEATHDYADVLSVFHAVIRGLRPIADYQHAVIRRYLNLHAADVAEVRSGLESPRAYVAPSIPQFLMREAA
jgi:hypothetical protein